MDDWDDVTFYLVALLGALITSLLMLGAIR